MARAYTEDEPLITVCIPTYNRSALSCQRALESVRRQSYERWEAVVVGDACTDDTAQRIEALDDPRVTFYNLPVRGPYPEDRHAQWLVAGIPPMNAATAQARGAWIAPLCDDDEWSDDHLEVLLAVARDREGELAYGLLRGRIQSPPPRIHDRVVATPSGRLWLTSRPSTTRPWLTFATTWRVASSESLGTGTSPAGCGKPA